MAKGDKIAKTIQKRINNKTFMSNIYKTAATLNNAGSLNEYISTLSNELILEIATQGKHKLGNENTNTNKRMQGSNKLLYNIPSDKLYDNCIENGFVTHSFNGYNLQKIKKNGLGSNKIYDNELSFDMEFLEAKLGTSKYHNLQQNSSNETYFTSPGTKSIYYATSQSPERLYLGPLSQDRNNSLPVEIGESKYNYMMKVINKKIEENGYTGEEKQAIIDSATRTLTKLCTKNPIIALIPIQSKNYELTASHATYKNGEQTFKDILKQNNFTKPGPNENSSNIVNFFTTNEGSLVEYNNLGNLVTTAKIPGKDISFIEVPDSFEVLQQIALARGMQKGDKIDYFTGMPYKEKEAPSPQIIKVSEDEILDEKNKNPEIFPKELDVEINDLKSNEKLKKLNTDEKI